jgi:hypothetical protein
MLGMARSQHRAEQWLGQLVIGDDDCRRARILKDMQMIAFGVGDIGRYRDAARRHDREIGDAPLWAVLGNQHDPVTVLEAQCAKRFGQTADLADSSPPS